MITIFTDGSSRGNPGPGGWGTILVTDKNVIELGGREDHTTNNRMELMAAIGALTHVGQLPEFSKSDITICSDSSYVINGITKWVHGWVKKNWITSQKEEVLNRDLWQRLMVAVATVEKRADAKISWKYVGGHVGIVGNERCDEIATSFADGEPAKLFSGLIADYSLKNILNISHDTAAAAQKSKSKSKSKGPAYSYISKIDGKVEIHKTWKECEARVKGAAGAKYKKSVNAADEAEIIKTL